MNHIEKWFTKETLDLWFKDKIIDEVGIFVLFLKYVPDYAHIWLPYFKEMPIIEILDIPKENIDKVKLIKELQGG